MRTKRLLVILSFLLSLTAAYADASASTLNVMVYNQDGSIMPGATVVLYPNTSTFVSLPTRRTAGEWGLAVFNVDAGSYQLEAYYNGEYWGISSVTVGSGTATFIRLRRKEPYAFDFTVYNDDTGVASRSIPVGTALRYKIRVRNSSPESRTVRVVFRADRDQSSPYEIGETASGEQTLAANGGTARFNFDHTPSAAGTYERSFEVESRLNGRWVKTDSWPWGFGCTAVVAPSRVTTERAFASNRWGACDTGLAWGGLPPGRLPDVAAPPGFVLVGHEKLMFPGADPFPCHNSAYHRYAGVLRFDIPRESPRIVRFVLRPIESRPVRPDRIGASPTRPATECTVEVSPRNDLLFPRSFPRTTIRIGALTPEQRHPGIDVTDVVRAWQDGTLPNLGFVVGQYLSFADAARSVCLHEVAFGADVELEEE